MNQIAINAGKTATLKGQLSRFRARHAEATEACPGPDQRGAVDAEGIRSVVTGKGTLHAPK
jgi:hypothetical protein